MSSLGMLSTFPLSPTPSNMSHKPRVWVCSFGRLLPPIDLRRRVPALLGKTQVWARVGALPCKPLPTTRHVPERSAMVVDEP